MEHLTESQMSTQTKNFIRKFKQIDQSKLDKIDETIKSQKEPVTISQVEYILR